MTSFDSATRKHNIATFAGAVGGSAGFLSLLALGLCISIRHRRRRAVHRERRHQGTFAENFTSHDHGADEARLVDDDDETEDESHVRRSIQDGGVVAVASLVMHPPMMAQVEAGPAPFIPRYFPGSVPTSPPPYGVDESATTVADPAALQIIPPQSRFNLGALGVTIPQPVPMLDLQRTVSGSSSYAERPPPTPPSNEISLPLFSPPEAEVRAGGDVGSLECGTPIEEESDWGKL